jgi:polyvinyl alcohol dehydrogenase (cytochrome)
MRRASGIRAVILLLGLGVAWWGLPDRTGDPARADPPPPEWTMAGQNLSNTRHQPAEAVLGADNVSGLKPRWVFTTGGDVSATPAIVSGAVYVPDWAGNLFKIDARTGIALWTRRLADYTGLARTFSRTTPAVADDVLYLGTYDGAYLLAVSAATGDLLWKTQLDAHRAATLTQSPVVVGQRVYAGVSSQEELLAGLAPGYRCCTFRGSVVAVDARTGGIVWRTYLTPDNGGKVGGYSGVAVWGTTAVVDAGRGALYVTTGNNYDLPAEVKACEKARLSDPSRPSCLAPDDHVDSVVALDLETGAVRWSTRLLGYDAWNLACALPGPPRPKCPDPAGPDYDFAQGAMLFTAHGANGPRQLLGAGQKSGIFWALDPATGAVVWSTVVGPGGTQGGMEWGSATDENRIYAAVANFDHKPYTLFPSGEVTRGGAWSALDAATGTILWQTATPGRRKIATGPVTVANGVVFAGSMARSGDNMYALDAATGTILWRFPSGGSVNSGPAVVDGAVYWGSGYARLGLGTPNDKLYAFELTR